MYVAIWLLALVAFVYIFVQILLIARRNRRAHTFFSSLAPELPVAPGRPNIFLGHLKSVIIRDDNIPAIAKLHEQLGPTFGYYFCEQPWVTTKNLDLIRLIELEESHKHTDRAPIPLPFSEYNHSIFQANGDVWRRQRNAIAPALTNRKIRGVQTTSDLESVLEQLATGLESRLGPKSDDGKGRSTILDAGDMFQRYSLAVIFLVIYQRERAVDFVGPKEEWVARIDWAARQFVNPLAVATVALPFTQPLVGLLAKFHPVGRTHAQIISYSKTTIDLNQAARERQVVRNKQKSGCGEVRARATSAGFKRRLVDTIIDALFERRLKCDEFLGNIEFLLLAGLESTAQTITCLVWHLARNLEIQERLRESVRRDGLDSEYLSWCVKETVRYHPAVPLGVGRVLGEDVQVPGAGGLRLPRGTFVMPSTHAIHHDPEIWPEPEQFKPERWQRAADHHPAAFMGFGLGARNCVGGKLATSEIKHAIKLLLDKYRLETCPETPDEFRFSSACMIFTLLEVPIKVRLVELD